MEIKNLEIVVHGIEYSLEGNTLSITFSNRTCKALGLAADMLRQISNETDTFSWGAIGDPLVITLRDPSKFLSVVVSSFTQPVEEVEDLIIEDKVVMVFGQAKPVPVAAPVEAKPVPVADPVEVPVEARFEALVKAAVGSKPVQAAAPVEAKPVQVAAHVEAKPVQAAAPVEEVETVVEDLVEEVETVVEDPVETQSILERVQGRIDIDKVKNTKSGVVLNNTLRKSDLTFEEIEELLTTHKEEIHLLKGDQVDLASKLSKFKANLEKSANA